MNTAETFSTRTFFTIIAVVLIFTLPDSYRLLIIAPIVLSWIIESTVARYRKGK